MEREKLIDLVTRAQKGDSSAMEQLFEAFYNDVYYFALKTLKDSDLACDITQETFLEVINTIGELKEPPAFVSWLKQLSYHQCTRYFKKKKDVLVEEDADGNTIFDTLVDESEGSIPAEVYEKAEFRQTILAMINELTEEQRAAVMLYYFDELPVSQIATIQGVSEGTVKSRLNYARKGLKKSVEDYEKKHNVKLHSVAVLPLLLLFFRKEHMPEAKAAQVQSTVAKAAGAMGAGAAVKAGGVALGVKIAAGVLAAAVALGGAAALYGIFAEKNEEPSAVVCAGKENGRLLCDEDGDFRCDKTGDLLCDEDHWNCHAEIGRGDGKCDACGTPVIALPKVFMAEDVLCILPGMVQTEQGIIYDQVDAVFEVYDLETGELLCTRSRWDVGEGLIPGPRNGQKYNIGNEAYEAAIKIPVSELTDATVCSLGVRAKSLDEKYASTGLVAARYVAVSELNTLDVTIDAAGVLRIGNYNADCTYRVYDVTYPECPVEVWFDMGETLDLRDILRLETFLQPPQGGRYRVQVYETNDYVAELYASNKLDIPVIAIWASYHGNHETVEFSVTAEEYWAAKEADPGPEPGI